MGSRLRIVVADDERDTREFFEFFLAREGHEVRSAEDGRRLVEVCREFAPDVIVTDYAMPGLNGLTAVAEATRDRPVAVVLISGRQDIEVPAKLCSRLPIRVLTKPVKEWELTAAVAAAGGESPTTGS